jgi:GNAT superfamily N-acetyltransferase
MIHEHSVHRRVNAWQPILDRGGALVGAFDTETLVGFAIYQPHLAQGMANLSALYVGRSYRRKGIGALLAGDVAYESSTTPDRAKRPMVRGREQPLPGVSHDHGSHKGAVTLTGDADIEAIAASLLLSFERLLVLVRSRCQGLRTSVDALFAAYFPTAQRPPERTTNHG